MSVLWLDRNWDLSLMFPELMNISWFFFIRPLHAENHLNFLSLVGKSQTLKQYHPKPLKMGHILQRNLLVSTEFFFFFFPKVSTASIEKLSIAFTACAGCV